MRTVALLAEGVDRNFKDRYFHTGAGESPSSRRAWIEIHLLSGAGLRRRVALLAEGVDRNTTPEEAAKRMTVALLAEGVDRNQLQAI